tara:strand:- start:424 stop:948 length:525 start_codon:yes stop_codon:yes gene_type:complete
MSLQFYKPNSKSSGTACSFWRNSEDNTFWVSLIKQDSWNSKTKTGSFSKNKDNPKKRAIVKFSDTEIAGFIDAIERNAEYSGYHGSQKQIVKFNFKPYVKNDEQLGFSFSVNREDKEDSTDKQNYLIGFYYPEAMRLKIYLHTILTESYKASDQAYKNNSQKSAPESKKENYDF